MQSWYSITLAEEEHRRAQILCMSPVAWRAEATRVIRTAHRGKTQEAIAFVQRMDAERARAPVAPRTTEVRTADDADWALWQDMVEEPAKYGDDIVEWLALDIKLRLSSKRWRVAAYWLRKVQEEEDKKRAEEETVKAYCAPYRALYSKVAKQAAEKGMKRWLDRDIKTFLARIHGAATKIQSAVRGHLARHKSPYLNCCMCLAHTVCPLETDVGMICRKCAEQGPHEDITGPIADPWNWSRAEYKDWTVCHCNEEEEEEQCSGCGTWYPEGEMDFAPGYGLHCSRRCGPAGHARDNGWGCN
jgi:hypothetical protein